MSRLKKHAEDHAKRVSAYKRCALRRWLRQYHGDPEVLPAHLYLGWGESELVGEVRRLGGDPDVVMEQARKEVVDKIIMERGL